MKLSIAQSPVAVVQSQLTHAHVHHMQAAVKCLELVINLYEDKSVKYMH